MIIVENLPVVVGMPKIVAPTKVRPGGSSLKAVDALREAGIEVVGMVAIFTYGFKAADKNFADKGVKLITLGHYNSLIDQAIAQNYISAESLDSLKKWRQNPEKWKV